MKQMRKKPFHKHSDLWKKLRRVLAVVVVFSVTYTLVLPAVTMDQETAVEDPGVYLETGPEAVVEEYTEPLQAESMQDYEAAPEVTDEYAAEPLQAESVTYTGEESGESWTDDSYYVETISDPEVPMADYSDVYQESYIDSASADSYIDSASSGSSVENQETVDPYSQMPKQVFEKYLELEEITIRAEAEEGAFPMGTVMEVTPVYDVNVLDLIAQRTAEKTEAETSVLLTVDIAFYIDGERIDPLRPIRVSAYGEKIKEMKEPVAAHLTPEQEVNLTEPLKEEVIQEVYPEFYEVYPEGIPEDMVIFEMNKFTEPDFICVYSLCDIKKETTLTYTGETYEVSVTYRPESGLPAEGTELRVEEFTELLVEEYEEYSEGTDWFNWYREQLTAILPEESTVSAAKFLDIDLYVDGVETVPAAPVEVSVRMTDMAVTEDESVEVVRFTDDGMWENITGTVTACDRSAEYLNGITFNNYTSSVYAIAGVETAAAEAETEETHTITVTGDNYEISMTYGPESGLPAEGVTLEAAEILPDTTEYDDYVASIDEALGDEKTVSTAKLFDITIFVDGVKTQPQAPVKVDIRMLDMTVPEVKDVEVVHFAEDRESTADVETVEDTADQGIGTVEFLDAENVTLEVEGETVNAVGFGADSFSVYGIVGTEEITTTVLTADGKTLKVTVNYNEDAQIPEGATLDVKEIQEGDEEWVERSMRLAGVLNKKYGNVTLSDARFLNISIMVEGEEYEPKAPVQVKIEYVEPLYTQDTEESDVYELSGEKIEPKEKESRFATIHYTDDGAEVIEAENTVDEEGITETLYDVDGFSDYDIVYMYDYESYEAGRDYNPSATIHTADEIKELFAADMKASGDGKGLKAAGEPTRGAGDVPNHSKTLIDNNNGTYTIGLNVTGDAETENNTASNANVIIIYDTSTSMVAPGSTMWGGTDSERNNYVPMATGGRGIDTSGNNVTSYSDGVYFQLYGRSGNTYTALTNDSYTGTVYRRTGNAPRYSYTEYTGQRYSYNIDRADASERVVYDFTDALFSYQNEDDPTNIQAAFITFDGSAVDQTNGWTSTKSDITGKVGSTGLANSAKLSYHNYTNWTDALQMAENLINSTSTDDDPTYVVFITDGRPQTSSESAARPNYNSSRLIARRIEQACEGTGGALYGVFAFANDDDWLASLLYYAYTGTDPANPGTTFDTEGYYKASDTAALTQAINDIFQKIVQTLGIGAVTIDDGTTSNVSTGTGVAHLLEVDESSYQYWLSIPVAPGETSGTYTFTMPDKVTGENVTYTVIQDDSTGEVAITWAGGTATYPGNVNLRTLTLQWTGAKAFYNVAPPAANFNTDTGVVEWDLNSVGTLLDGVTYTVTFDCYPSQYTLDLIADLKNGCVTYDDPTYGDVWDYIVKEEGGDGYRLKTNTTATLTYTDNRTDDGPQSIGYTNPEPRPLPSEEMSLAKDWASTISDKNKFQSVTFLLKRDGKYYTDDGSLSTEESDAAEFVLNNGNEWNTKIFIAPGLVKGNQILEDGHEYVLEEPSTGIILSDGTYVYDYEFTSQTVHPMMVDGKLTYLVKVDNYNTGDGYERYDLDLENKTYTKNSEGAYYAVEVAQSANGVLKGTNRKTAELDITKTIDDRSGTLTQAQLDEETFTYRVTLTVPKDADVSGIMAYEWMPWKPTYSTKMQINGYQSQGDDAAIAEDVTKFSGQYFGENNVTTSTIPGDRTIATMFHDDPGGETKTARVDITLTWNEIIRFNNLPEGTEYTIVEMYNNYREATPSRDRDAGGSDMLANIADQGYSTTIATKSLNPVTDTVREASYGDDEHSVTTVTGTIDYLDVRYYNRFTNIIKDTIDVELVGTKHLDGYTWTGYNVNEGKNERYWFNLSSEDSEAPLPLIGAYGRVRFYIQANTDEIGTSVDKSYSFGRIRFTEPGEYTYTIAEDNAGTVQMVNGQPVQFGTSENLTIKIVENGGKLSVESVTNSSGNTVWDAENLVATTTITNKTATVDVKLKKVDNNNGLLDKSKFKLAKWTTSWEEMEGTFAPGGTDETNPVDLGELSVARYRLEETDVPDGYIKLTDYVYFEVYQDTDGTIKARLTDETGAISSSTDPATVTAVGDYYLVTVKNTPGKELPHTGGPGTLPYTLSGLMLLMASALMYGFRMRRRERRLN